MTNKQNANTSEVRAEPFASQPYQIIKLGLDVHADTIVVVRILDNTAPQPAQRFTWPKFRVWIKAQLALADAVHSCYEAGPFGYNLHRRLTALGVTNYVVRPRDWDGPKRSVLRACKAWRPRTAGSPQPRAKSS